MTENKKSKINLLDVSKEDLDINLKNLDIFLKLFDYTNEVFFARETSNLNKKERAYIDIEFEIKKDYKFLTLISKRMNLVYEKIMQDRKHFKKVARKSQDAVKSFREKEKEDKDKISVKEREDYDNNLKTLKQIVEKLEKWRNFSQICKPDKEVLCRELELLRDRMNQEDYDHYTTPVNNAFINRYQKYFSGLSFLKKRRKPTFYL